MMNVVLNALSARWGGGQTYLLNLLKYARLFPQIKLYLLTADSFGAGVDEIEVVTPNLGRNDIISRTLWEKLCLPKLLKQLKADVLFCPGGIVNTSVPSGCLTAVTFQNMLIFDDLNRRKFPLGYMRCRLALLRKASIRTFAEADLVIALSDYAKAVLDREVPGRKGSLAVIYHGTDDTFRSNGESLPRWQSLPAEDYLLYVSLVDVYKAHLEVVRAFDMLCRQRHTTEKLVFVGPDHTSYARRIHKEIQRLGLEDRVLMIGQLSHAEMPSVYRHAKAHIFASTCENCPNIVIESLASGRPLFLSNRPPMPELAADAAVYFDPDKPKELADLLSKYLDDESWSQAMGRKARQRSLCYDWETTVRKTFEAILHLKSSGVT